MATLQQLDATLKTLVREKKRTEALNKQEREQFIRETAKDMMTVLAPLMESVAQNAQMTREDIRSILREIKVETPSVSVNVPDIHIPEQKPVEVKNEPIKIPPIKVPAPKVTVKAPDIKFPKFPDIPAPIVNVPDEVKIKGLDAKHPMPVIMMDMTGKPFIFPSGSGNKVSQPAKHVYETLGHGSKTLIGSTAVQLQSTSHEAFTGVLVKASNGNSGVLYVGTSHVTTGGTADGTDGFQLSSGESQVIPINNVNKIYVVSDTEEQIAYWTLV